MKSLYIHIPFCESKCYYCDFCSAVHSSNVQKRYIDKLIEEINHIGTAEKLKSVFIGGGTPSVLDLSLIKALMTAVKDNFDIVDAEVTIEGNPNSLTGSKLKCYQKLGINRLSIGVQTMSDNLLSSIGRIHTAQDVVEFGQVLPQYFDNFNFDIMLGLPNQTNVDIVDTINSLIAFSPTHISMYSLILEEGTPLFEMVQSGQVSLPDADETTNQYDLGVEILQANGYNRYEISNFSKPNFESVHNLNYWDCGEYYGVGLNAHSYLNGERFCNTGDLKEYLAQESFRPCFVERLTNQEKIEEYIMLGLRTTKGISIDRLQKLGYNIFREKGDILDMLVKRGVIDINGDIISITPDKFYVSNAIIEELI